MISSSDSPVARRDRRRPLARPRTPRGIDPEAVVAAHEATRRLLDATDPTDVLDAVRDLVEELGGAVVPARLADAEALPMDLSFGLSEPLLATAPPASLARMHLETLLPIFSRTPVDR